MTGADLTVYPLFGGRYLADVTNLAMKEFVDHISSLAPATIRDYVNVAKAVVASSRDARSARVPQEVIDLIRKMSLANPRWGAPRIHGELLKLGLELSEATVAKYMVRHRKPPSQTWRTFLANHMKDMASSDFFVVPTVFFRVLFVFVTVARPPAARPRAVAEHPTAEWVAHQLLEAFPWDGAPHLFVARIGMGATERHFTRPPAG